MRRFEFDEYRDPERVIYDSDDGDWVRYEDVEELISTLREYLSYDSTDGRKQRQPLREKLKGLI